MIVCVANTNPKKVKEFLKSQGFYFFMWRPNDDIDPNVHYGFYNFYDLLKVKTKKVPFFFNLVSAFDHIKINYRIYPYDYREMSNGLVFFKEPNSEELQDVLSKKYSRKKAKEVLFRPAKVASYEGSELARLWNNFILTLPAKVAEAFMVCFLQSVRNNDKDGYGQFIMDNRLIGTGNSSAFNELHTLIQTLWPALRSAIKKTEKAQEKLKKFKKNHPDLEDSISRFLFWNKSYKGKDLSDYLDEENNVNVV